MPDVKVSKVAVWKVGGQYHESAITATAALRKLILEDFLLNLVSDLDNEEVKALAEQLGNEWDALEQKVKAAMAGT